MLQIVQTANHFVLRLKNSSVNVDTEDPIETVHDTEYVTNEKGLHFLQRIFGVKVSRTIIDLHDLMNRIGRLIELANMQHAT